MNSELAEIVLFAAIVLLILTALCVGLLKHQKHRNGTRSPYQNRTAPNNNQSVLAAITASIYAVADHIHSQNANQKEADESRAFREKITIGALVFTFLAAGASDIILWRQIGDARDATMIANRAWVAPSIMALNWPLEVPGPVRVSLSVENTGREPAIDVVYRFRSFLVPYIPEGPGDTIIRQPNPNCEGLDPQAAGGIVIYPAKTNVLILSDLEDGIGNRAIALAARNRSATLIVDGCIAYKTFKEVHTSKFRFFLRDIAGRSCVAPDMEHINCSWQFHPIGIGNEAN